MAQPAIIELDEAAHAPESAGFSGYVHDVSLVDLLQIFHYSRRSLTLHVEPNSALFIKNGEIVHARTGDLEGETAVLSLLAKTRGQIRTADLEPVPSTVARPFQFLILDALRCLDEGVRDQDEIPEESATFPRRSRIPSVPGGNDLLTIACHQLAERVDATRAVAIVDLVERSVLAGWGSIDRAELGHAALLTLERPAACSLERHFIADANDKPSTVEEVRFVSKETIFFGKTMRSGAIGMVVVGGSSDAPGLTWAELRQSVQMLDRILP